MKIAILANSAIDEDSFVLVLFRYMNFTDFRASLAASPTAEQAGLKSVFSLFAGFALIGQIL